MSGQPPPPASSVPTSSSSAPQQQISNISMAGISREMAEQNQPVDLQVKQPLRIPTVPRPNLNLAVGPPRASPSSSGPGLLGLGQAGPLAILGNPPGGGGLRGGPVSRPPLLAVPKATTQQQQQVRSCAISRNFCYKNLNNEMIII